MSPTRSARWSKKSNRLVVGRLQCLGRQHGGSRGSDKTDSIGAVDDRLEVHRRDASKDGRRMDGRVFEVSKVTRVPSRELFNDVR